MGDSSFLENYDSCADKIRKLYDSRLRLAILDALKEGPLRLADLRREVNANAPNTSAKAKDLEEMGLVERVGGDFVLTQHGKVTLQKIAEECGFFATYEKFNEFWNSHNTEGIPQNLWYRIGDLSNSVLIKNTPGSITKCHDTFMNQVAAAKKKFYNVSPMYHDAYLYAVIGKISQGVDTKTVINKEVFDLLINLDGEPGKDLKSACDGGKWFIYEAHLPLGLSVSEIFLSLVLESKDYGPFMKNMDLQSVDSRAVSWGLDLFNYYKSKSKPVKLSDYL